jgi:IMP dehydrogenase
MAGAAIGVKGDYLERTEKLIEAGTDVLVIDVAHGHSTNSIAAIKTIKKQFPDVDLIVGNVATKEGTEDLILAGADGVKVGIGNGRICITRIVSGAGIPQLTALLNCYEISSKYNIPIIADGGTGGISGNIVKSLAAGASTVMLHGTLAGTEESPGIIIMKNGSKYKLYRGMASMTANIAKKEIDNKKQVDQDDLDDITAEGVESLVPFKGKASEILKQLLGGIKSGLYYSGANNLENLRSNSEFVKITKAGLEESKPHHVDVI